jgi:serine/threonine-protein kinase RsbT
MSERVLNREELPVVTEADVVTVRRRAQAIAHDRGLGTFAVAAITTAASELARNVITHGRGGACTLEALSRDGKNGVRMTFRDQGPGIADVPRVLAGGYSTAKSLGLGLSGSRRLVDEFAIDSVAGKGTVVTVIKWSRF